MNIGGITLKNDILFAPIAGYSDVGFRWLCASYGAGMTVTELVSAKGLVYRSKGTEPLLACADDDSVKAVQLFGSDPEYIFKAAADERLKGFDIIDINMGCPMKKVFANGDGCAVMRSPQLVKELVQAAKEGGKRPVTVKLRAGIEFGKPLAPQCAIAAEEGGAAAVTVHPRYREQYYGGQADHLITKEVKQAVHIPVIANGDISSKDSLQAALKLSGADGAMIGRAALGRPYIFAQLSGSEYSFCAKDAVYKHIEMLLEHMPRKVVANVMKAHLCYYAKGGQNAKTVRIEAGKATTLEDIYNIADVYLSDVKAEG